MPNPKSSKSVAAIATIILLAAGSTRSIENEPNQSGLTMEFVRVPAGRFYITPTHHVQFIKPFYMGKYEVTQAQWKTVMGTTVNQQHKKANSFWHLKGVSPEHPIYYVSWEEAAEFCKRLGSNFRLPSEPEWEYACRADSKTDFYYGNDPNYSKLDLYAWYYDNSKGSTHPVGRKKPNKWGLYDMYGNVSEWNSKDICRGSNWLYKLAKGWFDHKFKDDRSDLIGFRVVFTGNIDDDKKVLEIALPKEITDPNIAQEPKSKIKPVPRMAITGIVRDQAGIPIDGIYITILPSTSLWYRRIYPEGRFEIYQLDRSSQPSSEKYQILVRHLQRNLFTFLEFNEDVDTLDIKLEPGAILTGKVMDAYGNAIKVTEILLLSQDKRKLPFGVRVDTDKEGNFEIKGLPLGYKFRLTIRATGYLMNHTNISSENVSDSRIDLGPIVMARGQFSVSGIVLDKKRKPVANASVQCFIDKPVTIHTKTDIKGRFKADGIFEGPVVINASKEDSSGYVWYGQKHTHSGATNVKIVLRQKTTYGRRE